MLAEIFGRYDLLFKECLTKKKKKNALPFPVLQLFFLNHIYWVLLDAFSASIEKISICGEAVTITL